MAILDSLCMATPVKQYTDDTAMTKCIAESLITQRKYDPDDLAKRSLEEYKSQTESSSAWKEVCALINSEFKTLDEEKKKGVWYTQ
uniref:Uncharacterized protein n=1 Tax=Timema poppense TaxID=170557 RepID=A0A7R9CPK1_TIMPO|nr:unnamed protein product [Timema poppensis]